MGKEEEGVKAKEDSIHLDILGPVFDAAGISKRRGRSGVMLSLGEWKLLRKANRNPSLLPRLLDAIRKRKDTEEAREKRRKRKQ